MNAHQILAKMEQVVWILLETTGVIAQQGIQATTVKRVKLSNNTSANKKEALRRKRKLTKRVTVRNMVLKP